MRNRREAETIDDLLVIKIQGSKLEDFIFREVLKVLRGQQRKIFCGKVISDY
jgi:hypothetical protein